VSKLVLGAAAVAEFAAGERAAASRLLRDAVAEQVAPLRAERAALVRGARPALDVARARARLRAGAVAYDALDVVAESGDLSVPFVRAVLALERSGLATAEEAVAAIDRRFAVPSIVALWLSGAPTPSDPARALARRAAVLVAGAILERASADVCAGEAPLSGASCPCCDGPPEFALVGGPAGGEGAVRWLRCARCDAAWPREQTGCVSCGQTEPPTIARIASPALGYVLAICNACGRYVKERPADEAPVDLVVERALTAQLDAAAEARGLRL
jgi:hypothetical protein